MRAAVGVALHDGDVGAASISSWTSKGQTSILPEPRPAEVLHDGAWYLGDLTAARHEPESGCWWGFARYVVVVGRMHWQWRPERVAAGVPDRRM